MTVGRSASVRPRASGRATFARSRPDEAPFRAGAIAGAALHQDGGRARYRLRDPVWHCFIRPVTRPGGYPHRRNAGHGSSSASQHRAGSSVVIFCRRVDSSKSRLPLPERKKQPTRTLLRASWSPGEMWTLPCEGDGRLAGRGLGAPPAGL